MNGPAGRFRPRPALLRRPRATRGRASIYARISRRNRSTTGCATLVRKPGRSSADRRARLGRRMAAAVARRAQVRAEALAQAKDLEVASWLTEALLRDDGLAGFTAGVKLMTGLVEGFWDELSAARRRGDRNARRARRRPEWPLGQWHLDPAAPAVVALRPAGRRNARTLAIRAIGADRRRTRRRRGAADRRRGHPFDAVERTRRRPEARTFARYCQAAAPPARRGGVWETPLTPVGADAPTRAVRDRRRYEVDDAPAATRHRSGRRPPSPRSSAAARVDAPARGQPGRSPASRDSIATREDALRALIDIAEYFLRTEPLSPLAYTLRGGSASRRHELAASCWKRSWRIQPRAPHPDEPRHPPACAATGRS